MKLDLPDSMVDAMCNMLAQHAYRDVAQILGTIQEQANNPRIQSMVVPTPPATNKTADFPPLQSFGGPAA